MSIKRSKVQGAWLALSEEHGTPDLRIVSSSPMVGLEFFKN